jgi:signal transduction histidine kinase
VAVILALWFFAAGDAQAQSTNVIFSPRAKHVLMIFGEARDLPGNVMMEHGAQAEMFNESTNRIEFFTESLDSARFPNPNHYNVFKNYLKNKYAGQNLDLVMVFGSREFQQLEQLPQALFSNTPALYVEINDMDTTNFSALPNSTGIIQRFDVQGTIDFIFHLQPETRRVVVIGGVSPVDRATVARIADVARSVDGVDFDFWTNQPVSQLYVDSESLMPGTVILFSTIQRDVTGQRLYGSQILRPLALASSVPVYVLGAGLLGTGALGGNVIDFDDLGADAGKMAMSALNGTPTGRLPIQIRSTGVPMTDWNAMQRWHIKDSRLPANTAVLYRPHSLWEQHKLLIILVSAGLLAQALTIVGLLMQRRQRQLAEAEIQRQRTELAHVSRVSTIGQLASALTHELNQPLGAILRNTEAAEIYLQKEQPNLAEVRAILADIRKDDQRAGAVIDSMKTLLKRRKLESVKLDLRELVDDTVALAQTDAAVRGTKLTMEVPGHLPPAFGDRVHLQQVLLNLIFNGMDAMETKPRDQRLLVVRASQDKAGTLQVAVSDRGIGIAAGIAAHIFEPFFTTKRKGMGMGLSISGTIIEAHGGKIWAEGNSPVGTTFIFTVPRFEPEKDGLPATA